MLRLNINGSTQSWMGIIVIINAKYNLWSIWCYIWFICKFCLVGGYDGSYENDIVALDVENWIRKISWAGVFRIGIAVFIGKVMIAYIMMKQH